MVTISKIKNTHDTLRLATCSALRRDILIYLEKGKKPLSEIRDALGVSSTTAIHALRDLEKDTLVFQDEDRNYALTTIGELIALKLTDFIDAIKVLKNHQDFWLTHDLSGIPEHLLAKIGWLSNSTLLADMSTDIFKSHKTLIQVLENANEVKGIYPIFNLEYLEIIDELVRGKGVDVELVVTNEALGSIEGVIEAEEEFKKILHVPNFTLFAVDKDIKIALTLTDSVFYLGLFASDGLYDYNRALISDDEKTLAWGRELHEHYRKLSSVVDL